MNWKFLLALAVAVAVTAAGYDTFFGDPAPQGEMRTVRGGEGRPVLNPFSFPAGPV